MINDNIYNPFLYLEIANLTASQMYLQDFILMSPRSWRYYGILPVGMKTIWDWTFIVCSWVDIHQIWSWLGFQDFLKQSLATRWRLFCFRNKVFSWWHPDVSLAVLPSLPWLQFWWVRRDLRDFTLTVRRWPGQLVKKGLVLISYSSLMSCLWEDGRGGCRGSNLITAKMVAPFCEKMRSGDMSSR